MIPDTDYFLAQTKVRARREAADAERLVHEARREATTYEASSVAVTTEQPKEQSGAFGWLRRLAGAR